MPKTSKNYRGELVFIITALSIISVLLLSSLNLETYQLGKRVLGESTVEESPEFEISDLEKEKIFWENFLSKNPLYLDGWIRLSEILDELGDKTYALAAFAQATVIDPNSEKVLNLEKKLGL